MNRPLAAWAAFAGVISAAGLPLYIHAPKFFVDTYGVSLTALGAVLFGLRLLDVVQDPALGWLAERLREWRGQAVVLAASCMAVGMVGLFAIPAPIAPLAWFAVMLALVFSGFSFLTIVFYATGVAKADVLPGDGHLILARWRESGALIGICLAALLPSVFGLPGLAPFAAVVLLPSLEAAGFQSGGVNSPTALTVLSLTYAGVPCVLKLAAIALLATTEINEEKS